MQSITENSKKHNPVSLFDIANAINESHALAEQHAGMAIHRAKQAGELLNHAKAQVEHGQWLPWLAANCPTIATRTAQSYMRLASNWETLAGKYATVAHLTVNEALRLLVEPKPDPSPVEQNALHAHAKAINETSDAIAYSVGEVVRLVREAKDRWSESSAVCFEQWCEQELGLPIDLRDMLLDPERRWHPRYWDNRQADLVIRYTLASCGCSTNEIEEYLQDRATQIAGGAQ